MARKRIYLAPLTSVLAFWCLSRSWEHHSLPERPRMSVILLLLISGLFFFAASVALQWFPNVEDRFSSTAARARSELLLSGQDTPVRQDPNAIAPSRPAKWTLPVLITVIAARLEIFHFVQDHRHCSAHGVEFYLFSFLIAYQLFFKSANDVKEAEENEDPWRTVFDDFYDWLRGRRIRLLISLGTAIFFGIGAASVSSKAPKSTYMCLPLIENRSTVVALQYLAVPLDAAIVLMLWQILTWAASLKMRLRALATVSGFSAFTTLLVSTLAGVYTVSRGPKGALPWLYGFDILLDSIALALLAISMTIWICEASPVIAVTTMSLVAGVWQASANILALGTWMTLDNAQQLLLLWLVSSTAVVIVYALDMRTIVVLRRGGFTTLLFALLITGLIITNRRPTPVFVDRHPINELIYRARTVHDRWLMRASTSRSLDTAVRVYKYLHDDREPPPKFEEWYNFAKDTTIIDFFEQIDADLAPFRAITPKELRRNVDEMLNQPGVASLTIKSGKVTLKDVGDEVKDEALINLGAMVEKFASHLPDMVLPINLSPSPRVLPRWEARSAGKSASDVGILNGGIIGRSAAGLVRSETDGNQARDGQTSLPTWQPTTAAEFRGMLRQACPLNSAVRANPYWNAGELCWNCVKKYSSGQFLADWHQSLATCSQPDLKFFHGYWMTNPRIRPTQKLLPLFSASKTEHFADILIPLPRSIDKRPDMPAEQAARNPVVYWRGSVGEHLISTDALRGSHKFRLAYMANKPDVHDEITVLRWKEWQGSESQEKKTWKFEQLPTGKASAELPLSIGIGNYSACLSGNCDLAREAFGESDNPGDGDTALANKHVLVVDGDDGPDRAMLRTLRSQSLPYVATVFRTWYSERLRPWLHFVPIDVRYHGLHSTIAHFAGPGKVKREAAGDRDATWIAGEGRKWAEHALGEHDMEAYLFRLLLEWARLIDDVQDEIGQGGA